MKIRWRYRPKPRTTFIPYCGTHSNAGTWILDKFPKNYQNLLFIEALSLNGRVSFIKKPSKVTDILNIPNQDLYEAFYALKENYHKLKLQIDQQMFCKEILDYWFIQKSCPIRTIVVGWMSRHNIKIRFNTNPKAEKAWENFKLRLPILHELVNRVKLTNYSERQIRMSKFRDNPDCLFFLDLDKMNQKFITPYFVSTCRAKSLLLSEKIHDCLITWNRHDYLLDKKRYHLWTNY